MMLVCDMFSSILSGNLLPPANIGPRSGPGAGKKQGYGTGKQTLRLKSNGTGQVEEVSPSVWLLLLLALFLQVDSVRTIAEENINELLENFMGINDAELGRKITTDFSLFTFFLQLPRSGSWQRVRPTPWSWPRPWITLTLRHLASLTTSSLSCGVRSLTPSRAGTKRRATITSEMSGWVMVMSSPSPG